MRKNASPNASKRYPELHNRGGSPYWFFRKYSKEKKREFLKSTGILAKESEAAGAYKKGRSLFDHWLGTTLPTNRTILMRDLFRAVLTSKETCKYGKKGAQYKSAHNQILNHLIPAFGHFRPDQITARRWKEYDSAERIKVTYRYNKPVKRTALSNTLKFLSEAMRRAQEDGLIKEVPKFENFDPKPKPPKYLEKQTVRCILKNTSIKQTKFFYYLLWKQGPRPEEALQYEYPMIHWNEGECGYIHIPGHITKTGRSRSIPLNSRVSRILKSLMKKSTSPFIFPSKIKPGNRQRNYIKGWNSACQKAKVKGVVPYNLRDTFITNGLLKGLSSTFIGKYTDTSSSEIEKKYAVAEQKVMIEVAG